MDIEIREAEEGDGELLAKEFWHPLAREMEKYHKVNELQKGVEEKAAKEFRSRLENNTYKIFFLEVDGEEVGYVSLEKSERSTRKLGKYITVLDLYVKEGFREEGYGTCLMERAQEFAEEEDADYMMVEAEWDNQKAKDFYLENGFNEKSVKFVKELDRN